MACGSQTGDSDRGTPVSGPFTLHCDESVYPLVKVLTDGYMNVYPQVVITIDTAFRQNPWALFDTGHIYSLVTASTPSATDSTAMAQRNIFPSIFHFASDAVVFISGDTAATSQSWFTMEQEKGCLDKAVHPVSVRFITDHPASDNTLWIQDRFGLREGCATEIYSAGKHPDILQRVLDHPEETGIIGWSHLSEKAHPSVKKWRSQLGIIPFRSNDTLKIYPTQSALATGSYPLARKLYLATAEPYAGPATGFASFMASDEGQRIIRLFGLAPAKSAPREIIVN